MLAAAKTFYRWCVVEKKWLARNPLDLVKGIGKVRHGKKQLRIDEARKWMVGAHRQADGGQPGAVAALVMGMRASEIVSRQGGGRSQGDRARHASVLGHESFKTTAESYAKREAVAGAQPKRALAVLTGGKPAS